MNKVKVNFKSISEIVGTSDIGLLVLVDEKEERQLAVTCDKQMIHQLSLRLQQAPEMENCYRKSWCRSSANSLMTLSNWSSLP